MTLLRSPWRQSCEATGHAPGSATCGFCGHCCATAAGIAGAGCPAPHSQHVPHPNLGPAVDGIGVQDLHQVLCAPRWRLRGAPQRVPRCQGGRRRVPEGHSRREPGTGAPLIRHPWVWLSCKVPHDPMQDRPRRPGAQPPWQLPCTPAAAFPQQRLTTARPSRRRFLSPESICSGSRPSSARPTVRRPLQAVAPSSRRRGTPLASARDSPPPHALVSVDPSGMFSPRSVARRDG